MSSRKEILIRLEQGWEYVDKFTRAKMQMSGVACGAVGAVRGWDSA